MGWLITFIIGVIVLVVVVLVVDMLLPQTVQEYYYCGENGKGIVFIFEKSTLGVYSDNFRFMTPTEFETYCVKKVEGTH